MCKCGASLVDFWDSFASESPCSFFQIWIPGPHPPRLVSLCLGSLHFNKFFPKLKITAFNNHYITKGHGALFPYLSKYIPS